MKRGPLFLATLLLWFGAEVRGQTNPDYQISVASRTGVTGDTVAVPVFLNFANGGSVAGFSFGVCSDANLVDVECVGGLPNDCVSQGMLVPGSDLGAVNGGLGPDFFAPSTTEEPIEGWTVGCVVNLLGGDSLVPENSVELVVATYRVRGPEGSVAPLMVCDTGDPLVLISIGLLLGGSVAPTVSDGQINIETVDEVPFLRGDCNNDGLANVADAIFLLSALFLDGPLWGCSEACNADGDGNLVINDAVYLLQYRFLDGPPPATPFPECDVQAGADCENHDCN